MRHLASIAILLLAVLAPQPAPAIGGVCKTCPDFDAGPFTPTPSWQTIPGVLADRDCAWYTFDLIGGGFYEFATCAPGSSAFDSVLTLHDPALVDGCATPRASNDDCDVTRRSRLYFQAVSTGTVHVKVASFLGQIGGGFNLAYRGVTPTCTCTSAYALPTPQPFCQTADATLDATCDARFYSVRLLQGRTYTFTTCPATCAAATADFDARLSILPVGCGNTLASSSACAGGGQELTYLATSTGDHIVRVAGAAGAFGSYTMGYFVGAAPCGSCFGPFATSSTPTLACSLFPGNVGSCGDEWHSLNLVAGTTYEFTTCATGGACLGGTASFDTVLEMWRPSCAIVASNDDGCDAPRSRLTYIPTVSGMHALRVRGAFGAQGTYVLTTRIIGGTCVSPTGVDVTPDAGSASSAACLKNQLFTALTNGSPPISFQWQIDVLSGGSATPSYGRIDNDADGLAQFVSRLQGLGTYQVTVIATNACGTAQTITDYQLSDVTPPRISGPTSRIVECTAVPPPETPTVTDNCDPAPAVVFNETTTPGACPGQRTITRTWQATDASGNVSPLRVQRIVVRDTVGPAIAPDVTDKYCLYPPEHDVACFDTSDFSPTIVEACSPPVTWWFTRVVSSEGAACTTGDIDPDVTIAADGSGFCVRAERCVNDPGVSDGRRYVVFARAVDACRNAGAERPIGAILVPQDSADTSTCLDP